MPDRSPFTRDLGSEQGRFQRSDGVWVYELGHAGREGGLLEVGDKHEISQDFVASANAAFVAFGLRLRTPETTEAGYGWRFSALLNGTTMYQRDILPSDVVIELEVQVSLADANAAPTTNTLLLRLEVTS